MSGTELFYLCFHVQFLEVDIKPIFTDEAYDLKKLKETCYNLKSHQVYVGFSEADSRSDG